MRGQRVACRSLERLEKHLLIAEGGAGIGRVCSVVSWPVCSWLAHNISDCIRARVNINIHIDQNNVRRCETETIGTV